MNSYYETLVSVCLSDSPVLRVWVDDDFDYRDPGPGWVWFFTSAEALSFFAWCQQENITVDRVSLDHDLGGDDTTRPIVTWWVENDWWPAVVTVHSANGVGVDWLEGTVERYHPSNAHKYAHRR